MLDGTMRGRAARDGSGLALADRLLTVLTDGAFTSTYKYAVLLALVDLCVEQSTGAGGAPTMVTTRQLAEKVVELYWPQVRDFDWPQPRDSDDQRTLRQNSGKQAGIVTRILQFQNELGEPGMAVARARRLAPEQFRRLVHDVEWILVKMPLPKLQRVGPDEVPFLYRINWTDDVRGSTFRSSNFCNAIRFIGDAGDDLVRLAPLVRPHVQREWAKRVARVNRLPEEKLEKFLFGGRREAIAHLATRLLPLQDGRCFYCRKRIDANRHVDHFVPWSRHPDDGLDNLVVTHNSCNGAKRDHLAATEHVERWADRTRKREGDLARIADSEEWPHEPTRTLGIARSMYLRLPPGALLWRRADQFVPTDETKLRSVFGTRL